MTKDLVSSGIKVGVGEGQGVSGYRAGYWLLTSMENWEIYKKRSYQTKQGTELS